VACAIQSYNIDPRRIYTAGYSGGALQAVYMWFARSGYIASVVSYSGGDATINEATSQDTSNVAPALVAHGGSGVDELVLDFAQASATWETKITNGGGTYIDCNDGGSHTAFFTTRAPNLEPVAYAFLKAHPFGIKPEPYTSLPSGYPTYCTLNGAGTPPVGGAG
jgi:dienelactone hydrolase